MRALLELLKLHSQSKTIIGLGVILLVLIGLAIGGLVTPEVADVLKWVGASFLGVRGIANASEGLIRNRNDTSKEDG